jgi:hypothetical protein
MAMAIAVAKTISMSHERNFPPTPTPPSIASPTTVSNIIEGFSNEQ